jgi:outer membrane protein
MTYKGRYITGMQISTKTMLAAVAAASFLLAAPQALATDISDVGFIDQGAVSDLAPFQAARQQFTAYQQSLSPQYQAAIKGKGPADQQAISAQFNQKLAAVQQQLFSALFARAQTAIAAVAANKGLNVIVDKSIVIYGGMDITKDVIDVMNQPGPVVPPVNSPAPSEIGFVDQTQLDALPKAKSAQDTFMQFRQQLQTQLNQQLAGKTDAQKPAIIQSFNAQLSDEQKKVIQPLVDATTKAIANVAKGKGLLLVIDQTSRVYGGTDVTADVVKALQ